MWKKITKILFWLYVLPPIGIWMLWRSPTFSRDMKWRIFLYGLVVPLLAYFALSLMGVNRALSKFNV